MLPRHVLERGRFVAALCVASCLPSVTLGSSGCSDDSALATAPDAREPEAGGPMITVTTLAPALTNAPAAKATATWAAYRLDDGDWRPVVASSPGSYLFPLAASRWAVAVVCASEDSALTTVHVHRRTSATTSLDVSLEEYCSPLPPAAEFKISGNLTDVPPKTQWLDFGYARDSRGLTLPVAGGVSPYEEVGIEPGTWDLAFGIRDEAASPITRVIIRRAEVVTSDKTLDLDVTGPLAFVPSSKALLLRGVLPGDTVTPKIYYASGGPLGIDVGPQDIPSAPPDPALRYSTIPDAFQLPGDRYRGALLAEQDRRTGARRIMFDVHAALDLDVTFLPDPPEPAVAVLASSPQVRLETKFPVLPNAVRHEVLAVASLNRRTSHTWQASYDAAYLAGAAEVVDSMPDLSSLPGWKMEWGLPIGAPANVLATGYESPGPLGDGTMQRAAAKGVSITP